MKRCHSILAIAVAATLSLLFGCAPKHVLFYSQSKGFRHSVVARKDTGEWTWAEKHLRAALEAEGMVVALSQDPEDLATPEDFQKYDAIVLYTSGDLPISKEGLEAYIKDGGAFVGIHSATDTYKDWPEYVEWIGGSFKTHGGNEIPVAIKNEDPRHQATVMLGDDWAIADEMYQLNGFNRDNVHMLLSIDTEKMSDEVLQHHKFNKDEYYPVAWTNTVGKGRLFYTSLGHREDVWTNPKYMEHLVAGVKWSMKMK